MESLENKNNRQEEIMRKRIALAEQIEKYIAEHNGQPVSLEWVAQMFRREKIEMDTVEAGYLHDRDKLEFEHKDIREILDKVFAFELWNDEVETWEEYQKRIESQKFWK